jgi:hypothetical protein
VISLTSTIEQLAVKVAILRKERKDQEDVLGSRKKRLSGKRMAIQGHFMLSTAEIREKVQKAELETTKRKTTTQQTRKRKRQKTPSEDEGGIEDSSAVEESELKVCIVVGRC